MKYYGLEFKVEDKSTLLVEYIREDNYGYITHHIQLFPSSQMDTHLSQCDHDNIARIAGFYEIFGLGLI